MSIDTRPMVDLTIEDSPIHLWFELTYAQYLTIPRSVLQSMPTQWQRRFVDCLQELDSTIDWRPAEGRYWVELRDAKGKFVEDHFRDYERGRRRIETNEAECSKCHQVDRGQTGEYPCPVCGLPTLWDEY